MDKLMMAKPPEKRSELVDAKKNYEEIMKEVRPFIKKRKTNTHQAPKWEISNYSL